MPDFDSKILWIVDMSTAAAEAQLLRHAQAGGIDTVCIRTTNARLPGAIARFHQQNIKVFGWRWPGVKPQDPTTSIHHFADDEAKFVVQQLIPAKLDGYIVDPESEGDHSASDWNDPSLAPLAQSFCKTITNAAAAAGLSQFKFGITSGCTYPSPTSHPDIPWAQFVAASASLYPQTYWRFTDSTGQVKDLNGGNPNAAADRGKADWHPIANGKPIVYMAGELDLVTAAEISAYGARAKADGQRELHFYADTGGVTAGVLAAMKAL
jgi:hypothetical protein